MYHEGDFVAFVASNTGGGVGWMAARHPGRSDGRVFEGSNGKAEAKAEAIARAEANGTAAWLEEGAPGQAEFIWIGGRRPEVQKGQKDG